MKKFAAFLLAGCLAAGGACAEVIGTTGMYNDTNICRYDAPNGQKIYYVNRMQETSPAQPKMEDVNFDGAEDIVLPTVQGAANAWYEFWVWNGTEYVRAGWNAGEDTGLPNYELYPEEKLVVCGSSDGWAGALHHKVIYRWNGTNLEAVRYAVSEDATFTDGTRGVYIRVAEPNGTGLDNVLYEATLTEEQAANDLHAFDNEREALWEGLR